MTPGALRSRFRNPAIALFLFASGASGLVYEIVWARYLALFLGHTSYAVITVLVAFMAGLAMGSYWLGRRADRILRPLRFYALLELGIALYGLLFPWYYSMCRAGYEGAAAALSPEGGARLAVLLGFSFLAILPPTILMGGTLPVLSRFLAQSVSGIRGTVAKLYAVNSAGAVAGCVLADFWIIPDRGLAAAVHWGIALNLLAGLGALGLDLWKRTPEPEPPVGTAPPPPEEKFTAGESDLALFAIGVSGFVAMLYEVAWTRLLALVMGSSTHAFSIMLAMFISGIAAGAWIVSRWKSLRRTMTAFAWMEILAGGAVVASMLAYSYLPYWFASAGNFIVRTEAAYPLYELVQVVTCFFVSFVPTLFLGMTLPLASRIVTRDVAGSGASVGWVFAVNTVGTVLGAVVTGLQLMPLLGLARTFVIGAGLNASLGVAILARKTRLRQALFGGCALLSVGAFMAFSTPWFERWPQRLILGLWRKEQLPVSREEFAKVAGATYLKYYRDGAVSTVSVSSFSSLRGRPNLFLSVNGKPDAGTATDVPTQLLLGHLPMLSHADPQQALVIGLGSGMTCGAIATYPSVQRIDVVEISPEVVEACGEFAEDNGRVLEDPRLHVSIEDAKSFLLLAPVSYDVIVSEPSNPWVAGVAGLYSEEFYKNCRARLGRNGLMTQWVQLYETNDEAIDIVLRTFTSVFPHTRVWRIRDDLILVGSAEPAEVSLDSFATRCSYPAVRTDLERIDLGSVPLLLATEIISPENAAYVAAPDGPRHTDLAPVLEYVEQRAFFARGVSVRWAQFDETERPRPSTLLGKYLEKHEPTIEDIRTFVIGAANHEFYSPRLVRSLILRWQRAHPGDPESAGWLSRLPISESPAEAEVRRWGSVHDTLLGKEVADLRALLTYRNVLWQSYLAQSSAFFVPPSDELRSVLFRLIDVDSVSQRMYKLELAKLAWDAGKDQASLEIAANALDAGEPGSMHFEMNGEVVAEVIGHLAEQMWSRGARQQALELCKLPFGTGNLHPRLELIHRKLSAGATAAPGGATP